MEIILGILIPFIGTTLGSMTVYFLKNDLSKIIENIILGFAAGIMLAASIWSLLIPSISMSHPYSWLPSSIGLMLGILLFYYLDKYLDKKSINESNNLMLAVTIHNIPEGMAVGISFASYLNGTTNFLTCLTLAIGIAIQNFPEGSIISLPLLKRGFTKHKAFIYGIISALFELIGSLITLLFTNIISFIMPYLLSFAAGTMLYVIITELIPESTSIRKDNVLGFSIGFLLMMILDIALS